MDAEIEELTIDDEFKDLIPKISLEEYNQLEENISEEGVRDKIVVWETDGKKIIIDGHNRYDICRKHEIEFKTKIKQFETREEAIDYMIKNQLARRNLTADQKRYLIGKQYLLEKKMWGGDRKSNPHNGDLKTSEKIANEHKVSKNTVERAAKYTESVDKLHEDGLDREEVLSGNLEATQKIIDKLGNLDTNDRKEIIKRSKDKDIKIKDILKEIKIGEPMSKKVEESPPHIHKLKYNKWVKTLDDESIDLLITQPPIKKEEEDKKEFVEEWIPLTFSKIKDTGNAYIFVSPSNKELKIYLDALTDSNCGLNFIGIIAWTFKDTSEEIPIHAKRLTWQPILYLRGEKSKTKGIPTIDRQSSIPHIEIPEDSEINSRYKFQKPKKLIKQLIEFSTKKGDSIIDPFAGAGNFLITGVELDRKACGCENNDVILKVAENNGCKII